MEVVHDREDLNFPTRTFDNNKETFLMIVCGALNGKIQDVSIWTSKKRKKSTVGFLLLLFLIGFPSRRISRDVVRI